MVGKVTGKLTMTSVLLDTSFLISLVDSKRPNHTVASQYYRHMLDEQISMYFSAIAASEFAIKQPITDLPLKNFRSIPFNIPHSIEAARLWNLTEREVDDARHIVRDEVVACKALQRVVDRMMNIERRASLDVRHRRNGLSVGSAVAVLHDAGHCAVAVGLADGV